jgi:hypothetical protein
MHLKGKRPRPSARRSAGKPWRRESERVLLAEAQLHEGRWLTRRTLNLTNGSLPLVGRSFAG